MSSMSEISQVGLKSVLIIDRLFGRSFPRVAGGGWRVAGDGWRVEISKGRWMLVDFPANSQQLSAARFGHLLDSVRVMVILRALLRCTLFSRLLSKLLRFSAFITTFSIKCRITDRIGLHSVLLPLLMKHSLKNFIGL